MYESQYEWLDVEYKLAAAKNLVVVGPTCLSAKARSQESDGSENSDDLSESDDEAEGELADGLWLMDTGSGHDLTTPKVPKDLLYSR